GESVPNQGHAVRFPFRGQQARFGSVKLTSGDDMGLAFRKETFRDDFTFSNSSEGIRRFPFPFERDDYMYAVNIEPHVKGRAGTVFENLIDVDEHYLAEIEDKAIV